MLCEYCCLKRREREREREAVGIIRICVKKEAARLRRGKLEKLVLYRTVFWDIVVSKNKW